MAEQSPPNDSVPETEPEQLPTAVTLGAAALDVRRMVFMATARMLAYPERALWALLPEIAASLRTVPPCEPVTTLASVAERLEQADVSEQAARYVATFDFDEAAALYLTAHELGDSRHRGQALVELRALLRTAGFEQATEELPDYLPLLLEFLAHAPAGTATDALEQRLAAVCERLAAHLDASDPYSDVLVALRTVLPAPAEADPERRFAQREHADTAEMPFPLRYE